MKTLSRFSLALLAVMVALFLSSAKAADSSVYELRIYTTNEGKLPDLLKRFREHTCKLFEKHGITNIGYWTPVDAENGSENTLIYIIAHKSRDAASASWAAFQADPDWQAARKASEENGKILARAPESIFMSAAEYSPVIKTGAGSAPRVFELRTYKTPEGKLDALHKRFKQYTMALFTKHGMSQLGYWVPTDAEKGAGTTLIYILAHPSKEAGLKAFEEFRADPDWVEAKSESEKNGSLTVPQPDGVRSLYMQAVDFSPIK
ncbi:hypothetical protein BH11VER1_BH11VER1_42040 [soil metagenome]